MATEPLQQLFKNSELAIWNQSINSPQSKYRALKKEEIEQLESLHNFCSDWSLVKVEHDFDCERVRNSTFHGKIKLPRFFGTVMSPGGVSMPTGIYNCTLYNCIVENSHLGDLSLVSNFMISESAMLRNVGSLVCSGKTSFGTGEVLSIGSETGGRTIPLFPEMTIKNAEHILMNKNYSVLQNQMWNDVEVFQKEITSTMGYVGKNAIVCNTSIVRNSWIGPHARVDGAIKIRNSTLLSSMEQPCRIQDGAIVEDSILQWGSVAANSALVKSSILMEVSSAGKHALLSNAIIGPNTHVQESEITCSIVGPFVGLHHHSLLIGAIWPEGCGNVGYGSNIGSNHTGRLPDQEIKPGKGTFFGLSCNVKYPVNFSNSQYTLVSTGLTLLPQKMDFPFSLLKEPSHRNPLIPSLYNELIPAWNLDFNAYFLARNEMKFHNRDKSRKQHFEFSLFEPQIVKSVLDAWKRLSSVSPIREFYFEKNIAGIGKNYMSESVRQTAADAYYTYLQRFLLETAIQKIEKDPSLAHENNSRSKKLLSGDLIRDVLKVIEIPDKIPQMIKFYRDLEKKWLESIEKAMEKDFIRGERIFDDYEDVHPRNHSNYTFPRERFDLVKKRCNRLLNTLRNS